VLSEEITTADTLYITLHLLDTRLKSLSFSGSWITCNEALVYVRPKIPQKLWREEINSDNHIGRITKAHIARTLSNTVRLHTLERRSHLMKSKLHSRFYLS